MVCRRTIGCTGRFAPVSLVRYTTQAMKLNRRQLILFLGLVIFSYRDAIAVDANSSLLSSFQCGGGTVTIKQTDNSPELKYFGSEDPSYYSAMFLNLDGSMIYFAVASDAGSNKHWGFYRANRKDGGCVRIGMDEGSGPSGAVLSPTKEYLAYMMGSHSAPCHSHVVPGLINLNQKKVKVFSFPQNYEKGILSSVENLKWKSNSELEYSIEVSTGCNLSENYEVLRHEKKTINVESLTENKW